MLLLFAALEDVRLPALAYTFDLLPKLRHRPIHGGVQKNIRAPAHGLPSHSLTQQSLILLVGLSRDRDTLVDAWTVNLHFEGASTLR